MGSCSPTRPWNNNEAEAFALSHGLKWCPGHHIRVFVWKSTLLILNVDKGIAKPSWNHEPNIEEIKELIQGDTL